MTLPPALAKAWGDDLVSDYEERAAILELDAGMSREEAEKLALELVNAFHRERIKTVKPQTAEERQAMLLGVQAENAEHEARRESIWPHGKGRRRLK